MSVATGSPGYHSTGLVMKWLDSFLVQVDVDSESHTPRLDLVSDRISTCTNSLKKNSFPKNFEIQLTNWRRVPSFLF